MAINLDPDEIEIDSTEEPEEEEQDTIDYQISSYPSDMTLQVYQSKWKADQLLIPEFQREYVWDQTRASKLIESFLLGLPVPGVFLYKERSTKKLQVIDGQQRILSAVRFLEGRFDNRVFCLKNVNPKWEGKTFQELPERDQLQLQDAVLRATIVQQLDPDDNSSVYHIFERLNTGGVKLSPMEVRKCVYAGTFSTLLEELNKDGCWRAIFGRDGRDKRLRDVELILRFFAMRDGWQTYEKPMKSFLNNFMIEKKRLDELDAEKARDNTEKAGDLFKQTCADVIAQLGEKPFHLRKGTLNPGLLDTVMVMMSFAGEKGITDSKARYDALLSDQTFLDSVVTRSTSDTKTVRQRFEYAQRIMLG